MQHCPWIPHCHRTASGKAVTHAVVVRLHFRSAPSSTTAVAMEKAAIVALGSGSMPPYGGLLWLPGDVGLGGGDADRVTTAVVELLSAQAQGKRRLSNSDCALV